MAKAKIGGITVEIGADTSDLSKKLKDVNAESKKTTSELKSIDAALKQAPNSVELWRQKQEALAKSVENSKKKLEALNSEQENLKKGLENGTVTEEAYKAFQREIEITKGQIESAEKALKDFTDTENKAGAAAKTTGSDLEKSGKDAENSSEGYTMLKNAVANLATDGFEKLMAAAKDAWAEIDEGYDTIITKTGATGKQLEELQSVADNVYKSMPVEMTDTADAIGEINTRLQLEGEELEALTTDFLKYSSINDTQVASSVRNVSGIMKAFQEDTKNTSNVLDVLTDVSQRTGKEIGSLESELLSNAATFKEMDLDIRQSAELLGQFEANGIEASTALAGLKKAQQNATAEGKTMTEVLGDVIDNIKNAENETEALQIATDTFGKKGAAAMAQAVREQRFSLDDLKSGYEDMRDVVSDTFEATQDAPDRAKIALNNLKLELAKLAEAVLPKIEKFVKGGVENLPKIEKTIKNSIPLIKAVGAAYASWKIASTAADGVKALKNLTTGMQSTEKAAKGLTGALNSGTLIAVSALAGAIGEVIIGMKKAHDEYVPMAERIDKKVTAAFEDQKKAIDDVNDSLTDIDSGFKDAANSADYEAERAQTLWQELKSLADESGKVKDADKKRAEYIANELSEALGTEITLTGNQITNYQNLQNELDKVIEKKKASAYLDAYTASAGEMAKNKATVYSQYLDAYSQEQAALEEFNKLSQERYGKTMTPSEFQELMSSTYGKNDVWNTIDARMAYLAGTKDKPEGAYQTASANRQALEKQYEEIKQWFDRLEDAEKAFSEEEYKEVEKRLYAQKDADSEKLKSAKTWTSEAEEAFQNSLRKIQGAFKLAKETDARLIQSDVNELIKMLTDAADAGLGAGNKSVGEIFTDDIKNNIQDMLDAGFDISELAKWAKNSGIDIGDVFDENYTKIVQKQLDEGYSIYDLLQWGANSGVDVGTIFTDEFKKKYEAQLNEGFDITGFTTWAAEKGKDIGDVFGESFRDAYTQYIYAANNLVDKYSINSESDARYWREHWRDTAESEEYFRNLGWHAAGGFIPTNSSGIVAEAGPELLEVMNGGVRVTNLTPSGTNSAIGAGKGTTINNYYNSVKATVASKYDVYQMAEDLDTAERRINQGKGM